MLSAKTFNAKEQRPWHLETGTVTASAPRGGGATGVLAARTRILAIASRRRTVPSARGQNTSRQPSATGTNLPMRRHVARDDEIGRGRTNRRAPVTRNQTIEGRGPANPRRRTIDRGRRNRQGLEHSESRGRARSRAVPDDLDNQPAPIETIDRGRTDRVAVAQARLARAATNPRAERPVVRRGETGRLAATSVRGPEALPGLSANRSRLAAGSRVRDSTGRLARSGTTIRIGTRRLMISHLVLMKPRPDLSADERRGFIDAFERAVTGIPTVRGVRVGDRVVHGAGYEQSAPAMEYIAVIDFDDLAGLQAYLHHPAHEELSVWFRQSLTAAFVYDFEVGGVEELRTGRFSASSGASGVLDSQG